ncbi:OmpA family protein [Campylobacter hyointestinalis]|uniref:OmpA family protein n=1 Tax=Campylobacter hyointestinalis TaxID=198 RepID=A0A562X8R6_CAMHY|nr:MULTISPECIES: OmpA family protein [Campylobacter]TWO18549.1 OmpA family protein [Campylobacter hyointestinalis]
MRKKHNEDYWIALSDIMTALMLLFLLISVVYMIKVEDSVKIPQIFKQTTQGLDEKLRNEFDKDLKAWGAVIDKDLTIRFSQPDILFAVGSATLNEKFKAILDDFFPRYLKILMDDEFRDNIEEIRIEGHTSSFWGKVGGDESYLKNMTLSQERTRAVLEYIISSSNDEQKEWLKKYFRAIGFSSAKLLDSNSQPITNKADEDPAKSQRVEFRVRTNIEQKVGAIIKDNK